MNLTLRDSLLIVFNLFPLVLVLGGSWQPFDMMAFYWLELIVIGYFAVLSLLMSCFYKFTQGKIGEGAADAVACVFFPLHFGFFIVMTAFLVGSYLPEGTETRPLTDPLVPTFMVLEHMPFLTMLPMVVSWQLFVFVTTYVFPRQYAEDHPPILLHAYKNLFVLFISGFAGIGAAMATNSLLWGAFFLAAVKTLVAYTAAVSRAAADDAQKETAP